MENVILKGNTTSPKNVILCLHGLGDNGQNMSDMINKSYLSKYSDLLFVYPTAPLRKMKNLNNEICTSWYGKKDSGDVNEYDLKDSVFKVNQIIQWIIDEYHIDYSQLSLLGFSQGGVVASTILLKLSIKINNFFLISTFLNESCESNVTANNQTSVFLFHRQNDDVVNINRGFLLRNYLTELGYPVFWNQSDKKHEIKEVEIEFMLNKLKLHDTNKTNKHQPVN
jgi:predicted esterase